MLHSRCLKLYNLQMTLPMSFVIDVAEPRISWNSRFSGTLLPEWSVGISQLYCSVMPQGNVFFSSFFPRPVNSLVQNPFFSGSFSSDPRHPSQLISQPQEAKPRSQACLRSVQGEEWGARERQVPETALIVTLPLQRATVI